MAQNDDDHSGAVVVAIRGAVGAELRRDLGELDERVSEVDEKVGRLDERVDYHERHISDLRVSHAETSGQVRYLVTAYENTARIVTTQAVTDLEVRKAQALSEIKDREDARANRRAIIRELAFKAIAIAMGLWAIISSIISSTR